MTIIALTLILGKLVVPKEVIELPARVNGLDEKIIQVNGFDIWYRETGNPNGKPIIIIHGGPGLSTQYFENYLCFLKEDYKLIFYDQRGCGLSESKNNCKLYNFDNLIRELDTIIKDYVKEEQVILFGHSFGATLALKYALEHREKVQKTILVSIPGIKPHPMDVIAYCFDLYKSSWPPLDNPFKTNAWFLKRLSEIYEKSFYDQGNKILLNIYCASYAVMIYVMRSMRNFNIENQLLNFDKEVLILYGVNELKSVSKGDINILQKKLKKSTVIQFIKSGHWSFIEENEQFSRVVLDFLRNRE